jgi:hypothetical protein
MENSRLVMLDQIYHFRYSKKHKVVTETLMQNSGPEKKIFKKITAFLMANLEAE